MVLTRGGKHTTPKVSRTKGTRSANIKPNALSFEIFSDDVPSDEISLSKRPSPMKNPKDESPLKKVKFEEPKLETQMRPLVLDNSDNSDITAQLSTKEQEEQAVEIKKIEISSEELQMNGAPEGDLFEVALLLDSDLTPLPNTLNDLDNELLKQYDLYMATTVWAEKYEIITMFRRIVNHHSDLLDTTEKINCLLRCLNDGLTSLRSSNVRNSLFCLKKMFQLTSTINSLAICLWGNDLLSSLIANIFNRVGSGPKFLCDSAYETLESFALQCPIETCLKCIEPFFTHRNLEVVCKSIFALDITIRKVSSDQLIQQIDSMTWLKSVVVLLVTSFNAKKAIGKEKAKKCLKYIQMTITNEQFDIFLSKHFSEIQIKEMKRELDAMAPSSSVNSTKISRPALGSITSNRLNVLKSTTDASGLTSKVSKPWEKAKESIVASKPKPWLMNNTSENTLVIKPTNSNVLSTDDIFIQI